MSTTATATAAIPALDALREPIRDYLPPSPAAAEFQAGMLGLSDLLGELWDQDGDETLEGDIVSTVLYAFPALLTTGPDPAELVELALGGQLLDAETADTLHTVGTIRRVLAGFEPPGLTAALWRAVLLAMYSLIELFVTFGDERSTEECFALLDAAEALADRFAGKA